MSINSKSGSNPKYAVLMQEELGGENGELKVSLQYLSQRNTIDFLLNGKEVRNIIYFK